MPALHDVPRQHPALGVLVLLAALSCGSPETDVAIAPAHTPTHAPSPTPISPSAPVAPAPEAAPVEAVPPAGAPAGRAAPAAAAPAKAVSAEDAPFHWRLDIVREPQGFRVVRALRVDGPAPKLRRALRGLAWRFRVVDAAGALLFEGELADPAALRGEFHGAPGQPIEAVHTTHALPVTFSIRVPSLPAARIEFVGADAAPLGSVSFPGAP